MLYDRKHLIGLIWILSKEMFDFFIVKDLDLPIPTVASFLGLTF